jgi:hypothetical protein
MKCNLVLLLSGVLLCSRLYAQDNDSTTSELPVLLCKQSPFPRVSFPSNDSLTYDEYVGENIAGFRIANGWRSDSINGGFNKQVHRNPYLALVTKDRFQKQAHLGSFQFFRYVKGVRFTGWIKDTIELQFTGEQLLFEAWCADGMVQGKATLRSLTTRKIIAEAQLKNGELAGDCINRNRMAKTQTRLVYVAGSDIPIKEIVVADTSPVIE